MTRNPLDYYKTGKIILEMIRVINPRMPRIPYPHQRWDKTEIIINTVVKKIILKK